MCPGIHIDSEVGEQLALRILRRHQPHTAQRSVQLDGIFHPVQARGTVLEQFQFETRSVSNHTVCRFAEKTRFFRLVSAGRRCAAASHLAFFKGKMLLRGLFAASVRIRVDASMISRNPGKSFHFSGCAPVYFSPALAGKTYRSLKLGRITDLPCSLSYLRAS
ncbi:hypothetical protein [uncultured Desulfovibrio sp.]|uniref:hypothetical protein n=1 Tax=uncultured Desulfovibrio sp. TaxID=167968 RepID=UPI002627AB53|nr:hypothetical protein [uncultured Desulfovibrio sp.]